MKLIAPSLWVLLILISLVKLILYKLFVKPMGPKAKTFKIEPVALDFDIFGSLSLIEYYKFLCILSYFIIYFQKSILSHDMIIWCGEEDSNPRKH
jgi:hypothetical protein